MFITYKLQSNIRSHYIFNESRNDKHLESKNQFLQMIDFKYKDVIYLWFE